MSGPDDVGSLGRELTELFRTIAVQNLSGAQTDPDDVADAPEEPASAAHRCPHGWCPVCGLVELVQDQPELVDQVMDAALAFARTVRDVMESVGRTQGARGE